MPVKAKIRFDFKADTGKRRFFWQRRDLSKAAQEIREQNVSLLKSLPFQGLSMAEFDLEHDVYLVQENDAKAVAYAPVEMVVEADSVEDLMQLTLRTEFRKIKVLEPDKLLLSPNEMERFLFKVNEEFRNEIPDI
ncbi:MAG: hypothetical protein PVG90_11455 [Bacillota bacterium]|jgi:hypothetical protein